MSRIDSLHRKAGGLPNSKTPDRVKESSRGLSMRAKTPVSSHIGSTPAGMQEPSLNQRFLKGTSGVGRFWGEFNLWKLPLSQAARVEIAGHNFIFNASRGGSFNRK